MKITTFLTCACVMAGFAASAQYKTVNPQVSKIVGEVSDERIAAILKKLEGFGTRNTFSAQDDPVRGIGAARKWIFEQFRSYSPKLEVSYDQYRLKKDTTPGSRIPNDVDLYNVVAVLPGTVNKEERIIISGHYDSVNMARPPGAPAPQPGDPPPTGPRDPNIDAPGVTDDGSGTASVMELARGDKAVITTGKVKDHTEYNGQQQTVLSHVKVEIHKDEEVAA